MKGDSVYSPRLELALVGRELLEMMLEGRQEEVGDAIDAHIPPEFPTEDDRALLRIRIDDQKTDPAAAPWLFRAMIRRTDRVMVGYINFHGPPDASGRAELGYEVFADYRRRGYAEEAARMMMDWTTRVHGVRRFRAAVGPDNEPSLAMVRKLGFTQTGRQWDEIDGEELVFELDREGKAERSPRNQR